MKFSEQKRALACLVQASREVGDVMRTNLRLNKKVNDQTQHDVKLELDVRCQRMIEKTLHAAFPEIAVLGEEGNTEGEPGYRWVVDPIDGTVNFSYGIPHACVSIALQQRITVPKAKARSHPDLAYQTIVGAVYDPFTDELWTALRGQPARLNGQVIRVSARGDLKEAIIATGFAKGSESLDRMLPVFNDLIRRVRKIRMMGAAALAMTYVASGRFDGYVESGVRLWDIAAGGLILECAGGEFWNRPVNGEHTYRIIANNGLLRRRLERIIQANDISAAQA